MSKKADKMGKETGPVIAIPKGAAAVWNSAALKKFQDAIEIHKKPYRETEGVLNAQHPDVIREIIRHVEDCNQVFITPDHPDFAPSIPKGLEELFQMPQEVTSPRDRAYFMDSDFVMRAMDFESRQEMKADKGLVKQTNKMGNGATKDDPVQDRSEQACFIRSFGFNICAVGDDELRKQLMLRLTSIPKPVQHMVSQRHRIPYYPEGNKDLLMEMALEPIHAGETFTGFVWVTPKIDIEIKKAPADWTKKQRHAAVVKETERLINTFPLTRQLKSSPTPGFDALQEDLRQQKWIDRYNAMGNGELWWENNPERLRRVITAAEYKAA